MFLNNIKNEKSKEIKKGILIAVSVCIIILLLCVLQYVIHYYSNPFEEIKNFSTTGYLIFDPDGKEAELVSVEIRGKNLRYIFHNQPEAVQGDIFINGNSIFGHGKNYDDRYIGFFTPFMDDEFATVEIGDDDRICEIVSISKNWEAIVCGINIDSQIIDSGKTGLNGKALLIIPADDLSSAKEIIKNVSLDSEPMNRWLTENGWIGNSESIESK